MKVIDIVFTVDYEIHGNGQGEFSDFCYRPTELMLDIANVYGAKISLMAEMEHYFSMQLYPDIFYKDIRLFEAQLSRAIKENHDVQLHLHPQWLKARYQNGRWEFPYTANEIALLCNNYEIAFERVRKAKDWLTHNLQYYNSKYECVSFRAGYFQMQPSSNITRALIDNGIFCDTSVVKGLFRSGWNGNLDYRDTRILNRPYRASMENVALEDKSSPMIEFPINVVQYDIILNKFLKIFGHTKYTSDSISKIQRMKIEQLQQHSQTTQMGYKVDTKIKKLFHPKKYQYLDFCHEDPNTILSSIKVMRREDDSNVLVVLIAHSKDFVFSNQFKHLLEGINQIPECNYLTLQEASRKYYELI